MQSSCARAKQFGVHRKICGVRRADVNCAALPDKVSKQTRTVTNRVQISAEQDYANTPDRRYINFTGFPFPLGPLGYRKTTCRPIIKDVMWSFEQPQSLAFSSVHVNVRMTVTRLSTGGLLIYNPIAPTTECLQLLAELNEPVKYIVLGTAAYEHKIFVGPFSRRFPDADIYITPNQWSFPLNLPVQLYGIFPKGTLRSDDPDTPWAADFEQKVFTPPKFAVAGLYAETALFHRSSKTLLVTDSVIQLPVKPPDCISPETLLANAKNGFVIKTADQIYSEIDTSRHIYDGRPVPDTPGNRLRGWQRICLLVCFFGPSRLYNPEESFDNYAGRPIVFPVVSSLVFSRCGEAVREWVEDMAESWAFKQIVPSHFDAPVPCTGRELIAAYQRSSDVYADGDDADSARTADGGGGGLLQKLLALRMAGSRPGENVLDAADLKALEFLNRLLEKIGAVNKRPRKPAALRNGE